jgi:osmotically-inducible protein OsmY
LGGKVPKTVRKIDPNLHRGQRERANSGEGSGFFRLQFAKQQVEDIRLNPDNLDQKAITRASDRKEGFCLDPTADPQRTQKEIDTQLRDDVFRQLEWDPRVAGKNINVAAASNVVTLTGFVSTPAEKYAAGRTAQGTHGVKVVANDIEVRPANMRADTDIAHDLTHALRLKAIVPDDKITASVIDGYVTLKGTLEWDFQRKAAEKCVREVAGVKGLANQIKIKLKPSRLWPTISK